MVKVNFIIPPTNKRPVERIYGCNYGFFNQHNILMLYPATMLEKAGYKVKVTDFLVDGISDFNNFIKQDESDVYVFYSNFLSRDLDKETARRILNLKKAKIIFIGSDPSHKPEHYLFNENAFVIRGESEEIIVRLAKQNFKNLDKIKGISYLKNGTPKHNGFAGIIENIDTIPFPDRSLYKYPRKYGNTKFKKYPSTTMLTSRGCPYRCVFCVPNSLSFARELEYKKEHNCKPPLRLRSAENVIEEFKQIKKEGYNAVQILDDMFVWGKERVIKICNEIAPLKLELSILARADHLKDEDIIKAFVRAGVEYVDIGVESFNQKILDDVRKDVKVKDFHIAIKNLRKYGLEPEINIVFAGSKFETRETIKETLSELKKLKIKIVHLNACAPFPGTEFNKIAKENKWMITKEYVPIDPNRQSIIDFPHLKHKEVEKLLNKAWRQHYLNPEYLFRSLLEIKSPKEFKNKFMTMVNMFIRRN
jgi:anaerobic magnesium-protoporphyrin IX monomethyl ester cyclase